MNTVVPCNDHVPISRPCEDATLSILNCSLFTIANLHPKRGVKSRDDQLWWHVLIYEKGEDCSVRKKSAERRYTVN